MGRITRGFGQPWAKITCGFGLSWAKLPMGLGYHAQNSLGWRVTRSRAHSTSTSTRRARPPHHDDGGVMESWRMRELAHARTTTELLLLSPRWAECHAKQSHMALGVRVCVVFPRWAECHAKPSHMALDVRVCVRVCVVFPRWAECHARPSLMATTLRGQCASSHAAMATMFPPTSGRSASVASPPSRTFSHGAR